MKKYQKFFLSLDSLDFEQTLENCTKDLEGLGYKNIRLVQILSEIVGSGMYRPMTRYYALYEYDK